MRVFRSSSLPLLFAVGLGLASFSPLLADRIYLRNGNMLRGKVLRIGVNHYKFQKSSDSKVENVAKSKITKVIFSRGRSERGYDRFFARLLVGMGTADYGISLNEGERELKSSHPLLRLGAEAGYQVIDYHLAPCMADWNTVIPMY